MRNPGPSKTASVVVPGNHDGVHVGHQALLRQARSLGAADGLRVVALFFDPHPSRVLAPERAPMPLTTAARRAELLRASGADDVHVQPFDHAFAGLAPRAFAETILVETLRAKAVVVGPDFRFGKGRAGSVDTLRTLGESLHFQVHALEPVAIEGVRVSSSTVRALLAEGRIEEASRLLGRTHETEGLVEHGQALGRTLGFPTANLSTPETLLPKDGIYAIVARVVGEPNAPLWQGVASLGARPTVTAGRALEAHLFDVAPNLYGKRLRLGWVSHLRDEVKFDGLEALRAAMAQDAAEARGRLERLDRELVRWV